MRQTIHRTSAHAVISGADEASSLSAERLLNGRCDRGRGTRPGGCPAVLVHDPLDEAIAARS